jgi:hypothetical protein
MYKLVKDNGKLFVQHEYSEYTFPKATRMWWEVEKLAWSPYATAQEREEPVGQELRTVTSAVGPSFYVGKCDIFLPDGGKTQACRIWRADIPAPKRGNVEWRNGEWVQVKSRKVVPVQWDELEWVRLES